MQSQWGTFLVLQIVETSVGISKEANDEWSKDTSDCATPGSMRWEGEGRVERKGCLVFLPRS
jgi:hypothetical protein